MTAEKWLGNSHCCVQHRERQREGCWIVPWKVMGVGEGGGGSVPGVKSVAVRWGAESGLWWCWGVNCGGVLLWN